MVHAETQSSETTVSQSSQQSLDAIQQFVRGDFATRRALLNQWPASVEQLDQLAEFVEKDQLYILTVQAILIFWKQKTNWLAILTEKPWKPGHLIYRKLRW